MGLDSRGGGESAWPTVSPASREAQRSSRSGVRCTARVDEGLTVSQAALGPGAGGPLPEAPGCPSAPLPQSWRIPSSQDKNGPTQGPWELVTPRLPRNWFWFSPARLRLWQAWRALSTQGVSWEPQKQKQQRTLRLQRLLRLLSQTAEPDPRT